MLFTFTPGEPGIVDWDAVLGGQNAYLTPEQKINALDFLLHAYRVVDAYVGHVHAIGLNPNMGGTPSLLSHLRSALALTGEVRSEHEFMEYVDRALIGLCNSLTMILGSVRTHMAIVADGDLAALPMMVAERNGTLMPALVCYQIEDKINELKEGTR